MSGVRRSRPAPDDHTDGLATAVHAAAVRLLRGLRVGDSDDGLTAPRASALSVLVFGGPQTITALATAEQVRPPTMSRLVRDMTRDGLVVVRADPEDARVRRVTATTRGRRLLLRGRERRVGRLARRLTRCTAAERRLLASASSLLLTVAIDL